MKIFVNGSNILYVYGVTKQGIDMMWVKGDPKRIMSGFMVRVHEKTGEYPLVVVVARSEGEYTLIPFEMGGLRYDQAENISGVADMLLTLDKLVSRLKRERKADKERGLEMIPLKMEGVPRGKWHFVLPPLEMDPRLVRKGYRKGTEVKIPVEYKILRRGKQVKRGKVYVYGKVLDDKPLENGRVLTGKWHVKMDGSVLRDGDKVVLDNVSKAFGITTYIVSKRGDGIELVMKR